jgi:hopene-associated glycosyltransferase HpnB
MDLALTLIGGIGVAAWSFLLAFRGRFYGTGIRLDGAHEAPTEELTDGPPVVAVIPARNEADVIGDTLASVLAQDYANLHVILVDDHSDDGTAAAARAAAQAAGQTARLTVIRAADRPAGWAGKVWAMAQGLAEADRQCPAATYVWLTDADVRHDSRNLARLVGAARDHDLDLTSQMVKLAARGFWETLLIPAFVLFFAELYPFAWVNDPKARTAAAAGGCVLVRRAALRRAGDFDAMKAALIDDCTLAANVKRRGREGGGRLRLALTTRATSVRPYGGLRGVWRMVTRSAYTQLHHSVLLLAGTVVGMLVLYAAPPLLVLTWPWHLDGFAALLGGAAWLLIVVAARPMYRFYGVPQRAWLLPLAGALYTAMTVDSALQHWRGAGGAWKGRTAPDMDGSGTGG